MVLGGALAATLALSLIGLFALRLLGPEMGFLQAAIFLALCIGGLTAILVRLLMRPIASLARYAGQVRHGVGDPPAPPRHYGTQELGAMGQSVLDMAETLQSRAATVRGYTDHVTHELKTPVSAIRAAAELLEDSMPPGASDRQLIAQIMGATDQMQVQLDALRRIAAAREPRYHGRSTLMQVAEALGAEYPALILRNNGAPEWVPLAADGLRLILGHLFANAAQHGATEVVLNGSVDVERVEVTVTDNGTGISGMDRLTVMTRRRQTHDRPGVSIIADQGFLAANNGDLGCLQVLLHRRGPPTAGNRRDDLAFDLGIRALNGLGGGNRCGQSAAKGEGDENRGADKARGDAEGHVYLLG